MKNPPLRQKPSGEGATFIVQLDSDLVKQLQSIERKIIVTQQELSVALDKLTTQVGKVAKEQSDRFDTLTAEIKRLTDLIQAGEVTPEVAKALETVQTALTSLDDAIPDAPAPA